MRKAITLLMISWLIPGLIVVDTGPGAAASPPQELAEASAAKTTPARPSDATVEVSGISIQAGAAGEAFIDVATTRSAPYRVMRLKNPERLVVDLEGARNSTAQKIYSAQSQLVKDVRVGQFREINPAVVRVVADLATDPVFDVHAYRGGVRIELRSRSVAAKPAVSSSTPVNLWDGPAPALQSYLEPPVSAPQKRGMPISTRSLPKVSKHEPARPIAQANEKPAIDVPPASTGSVAASNMTSPAPGNTAFPIDYQKALPDAGGSKEVTASPRPIASQRIPEAIQSAKAAKIVEPNTSSTAGAAAGQEPATAAPATDKKYSGEPISLNLKDVDLKDFFRLVHEISGLNIIIDPNVSGSVTMVLDAVPWDQALDIVLKNNRLDKTLEGNVLRIAKVETLSAEQQAAAQLAAAREDAQPLVTIFRPVNYAKATLMATMLKAWTGGGALSKRGTVLVDDRTNTLVISDIQTQIPVIESIIGKLDKKAKQVAIEARIILATASFSRSLQAALSGGTVNQSTTVVTGGSTGTGAAVTPNIVPPPRITIGQTSAGGFGAYAISNASTRYFINAAIAAAETKSEAKTISRPTIVTQNNLIGKVQQGSQIPIQTSINNTISIQYIAATLSLEVTPQVTDDGNIFMIINVQNASPGPALTTAGPSINTQSATTQVLVPDGGTVVFGGVTVTSRTKSATYVPLLGNIPVLGNLFKASNVQDNDNELLFFVTPKILPG